MREKQPAQLVLSPLHLTISGEKDNENFLFSFSSFPIHGCNILTQFWVEL